MPLPKELMLPLRRSIYIAPPIKKTAHTQKIAIARTLAKLMPPIIIMALVTKTTKAKTKVSNPRDTAVALIAIKAATMLIAKIAHTPLSRQRT